jgi:hypothetical protein
LLADSIVSSKVISGSTSLGLSYLISDVENEFAPNLTSSYGISAHYNDALQSICIKKQR